MDPVEGNQGQGNNPAAGGTSVFTFKASDPAPAAGGGNAPGGTTEPQGGGQPVADPGWLAGVDADTRQKYGEQLRAHNTVGKFVNAAMEAQDELKTTLQGAIIPPGENATPGKISAFRKALGVPESADQYQFVRAELPKGMTNDEALLPWFAGTAHKLNLSQPQAAAMLVAYDAMQVQRFNAKQEANQKAMTATDAAMKNEYGEAYEGLRNKAALILRKEGGDELAKHLEDSGLGNNPLMVKAMIGVAKQFSEDYFVDGSPAPASGGKTRRPGEYSFPNTPGME